MTPSTTSSGGLGVCKSHLRAPRGGRLIGRERDSQALQDLLKSDRVSWLSVTGPGGIGKTRLALQVAEQMRAQFEHGVVLVLLAAVRDPELVVTGIAEALGLQGQDGRKPLDRVKTHLRERQLLLVLDNFEQVVKAAPMMSELLQAAPGLKLLVTSRTRLHGSGEHEYSLGALQLPRLPVASAEEALKSPAVALFVQRAQAVRAEFELGQDNAEAVAAICVRLDGWPLAIELAAARVRLMAPQALLQRLQQRLQLLSGGPVDQPQRHRTLRSTLDWSHELLEKGERELFAQLSVFNGGVTLEAIEAVCPGDAPGLLETLEALVDHSLVMQQGGRFLMLETIREYARERLQAGGQADAVRLRHARNILSLSERAEPELRWAGQKAWFDLQAVDVVAENRGAPMPTDSTGLTPREFDVLRLVAQSLSDRQIGQRLGIRPATVSKHVANLLGKTMLRNRLALALWAIDRGPPAAPGLAVNAR